MKSILLLIAVVFAFSGVAQADRVLKVKSKNYSCSELNELVQQEGTVMIKWIGSVLVHAEESACRGRRFGEPLEAYQTTWRTTDKRFCVAGYSCRVNYNEDR